MHDPTEPHMRFYICKEGPQIGQQNASLGHAAFMSDYDFLTRKAQVEKSTPGFVKWMDDSVATVKITV